MSLPFVQTQHTSIETHNCGKHGFVALDNALFVGGNVNAVSQFLVGSAPDASNELVLNGKLEVLDVSAGDDAFELLVLTTYDAEVRAARGFDSDVYPLFVSLFHLIDADTSEELWCQPLPLLRSAASSFSYDGGTFLVAHGNESATTVLLYQRVANGKKVSFLESARVVLPQLPNVLNVVLRNGVALLYTEAAFVVWPIRSDVDVATLPVTAVADLSTATLTTDGSRIITATTGGKLDVLDAATLAVQQTLTIALDASTSFKPQCVRAVQDDGPSQVGDEFTIEQAVMAANAAASGSDDDDDDDDESEDTIFANSAGGDSSDESEDDDEDGTDTDMSDVASSSSKASAAAAAPADVTLVVDAVPVFNDIINLAYQNDTLYVHTYSDDLLVFRQTPAAPAAPETTPSSAVENADVVL